MSDDRRDGVGAPRLAGARHWAGFLVSGGIAFAVDALVLQVLVGLAAMPVLAARLIAIAFAMVAGWLAHRRWTFAVAARPNLAEFLRYAGLAWVAAAINYAIFALLLFLAPGLAPLAALVISSLAAMAASYAGMRLGVFRR